MKIRFILVLKFNWLYWVLNFNYTCITNRKAKGENWKSNLLLKRINRKIPCTKTIKQRTTDKFYFDSQVVYWIFGPWFFFLIHCCNLFCLCISFYRSLVQWARSLCAWKAFSTEKKCILFAAFIFLKKKICVFCLWIWFVSNRK